MVGEGVMRQFEKAVMLQSLDNHWKEHLAAMDYLRQGIHLRGYAQKNPKQEYKRESFELFAAMLDNLKAEVISLLSKVKVQAQEDVDAVERKRAEQAAKATKTNEDKQPSGSVKVGNRTEPKVGRNEPCPCGSGKKYKQCCGKL